MNIHRPEIVPGTGDAVKLYVPESPGSKWGIAVETHPDTSWCATRWNGEVRMTEDMLRSFVEHAAGVLRMSVIATPPASVASMDAPPSGFIPLFGTPMMQPVIVGGGPAG